ncbi:MAG: T9SS type A sorting domain-containing protein, partial [Bacteroidetes bacterium]|nr:T9SS type A sorting domain-containing protein [Bacteroidota bacterium]
TKGNTNIHSSINNSQFTINNYYEDPSPLSGANYYRLQTTSTDGAVAYSNMIMINSNEDAVRIYPNPAKNILHIEGLSLNSKNLPAGRQVKITVADFMGNIAISQQLIANSPSSYSLNVASLKPGNYLMKIETGGEVVVRKFIKE